MRSDLEWLVVPIDPSVRAKSGRQAQKLYIQRPLNGLKLTCFFRGWKKRDVQEILKTHAETQRAARTDRHWAQTLPAGATHRRTTARADRRCTYSSRATESTNQRILACILTESRAPTTADAESWRKWAQTSAADAPSRASIGTSRRIARHSSLRS